MAGSPKPHSNKSTLKFFTKKNSIAILIFLFFSFNSILFFYTYNIHHYPPSLSQHVNNNHPLRVTLFQKTLNYPHPSSKPWPILPSYLPWNPPSSSSSLTSCEGFFGNGFSNTSTVLPRTTSSSSPYSWFRCHYSRTLQSSVCEAGRVLMDPNKIRMSVGGERIEEVIGRSDDDELPVFEDGAFRLKVKEKKRVKAVSKEFLDEFVDEGVILRHIMRELFQSMELVDDNDDHGFHCSQWIEEPTLLVTRFEYANVFHTYTDWYSSYVSSRVTGLPTRPNVVFVDGHSKTQLEETWQALFSSIRFAKNFTGPVCFRHAVFVPLGYETAWFKGLSEPMDCRGASSKALWVKPNDRKTARLSEFGEMIKAAFGFPVNTPRKPKPSSEFNVLFVRHEDYLAHPRHGGKVESRLSNEQEVYIALKIWSSHYSRCNITLINGLFGHMPMKEQVRAIEDASVIIGAHGAGLTHVVTALPKTVILEIISSQFRRPHFQLISQWKGLDYHAINLSGSSADPAEVIERLKKILKGIGC